VKLNTYESKNQIENPSKEKKILPRNMLKEEQLSSSACSHLN
jgi:hypothetical protein